MTEVDIRLQRDRFHLKVQETFTEGITGIFGPSGSGKTSLLHAVAGLLKPESGKIRHGGRTLFDAASGTSVPVRFRRIGYVFQEGRLFPHMTVAQNLTYGMPAKGAPPVSFEEVVGLLELDTLLERKPAALSGGEKQRTALGRALLSAPEMLLMDEPFAALDQSLRQQIAPLLIRIHRRAKIPIWVVSHDLPDLLRLTSRLCLIREGRCMGHDAYFNLLHQPAATALLGASPVLNSLDLEVHTPSDSTGLAELRIPGQKDGVLRCPDLPVAARSGQHVRVVVRAADIALATGQVTGISIQNQLHGQILQILQTQGRLVCEVDIGVPLLVEITEASLAQLKLKPGLPVWCLIKSVAVQVVG